MNSAALEKLRSGWRGCGVSGWFAVGGGEGRVEDLGVELYERYFVGWCHGREAVQWILFNP